MSPGVTLTTDDIWEQDNSVVNLILCLPLWEQAEATLCRIVPRRTLLLGSPSFPSIPASPFLVSLGSTSLINHTNPFLRVCIWGVWPKQPSKKFQDTCPPVVWGWSLLVIVVTTEEEQGRVMAKLPWSCRYGDKCAGLCHKAAFFQVLMLLWKHRAWSLQEHSVLIPAALSICFVSH